MFLSRRHLVGALVFCLMCGPGMAQPQRIVAGGPALAVLVRSLVPTGTEVSALVPAGVDPHHAHLLPAQVQAAHSADLVIWLGSQHDTLLAALVGQLRPTRVHQLAVLPALVDTDHPWLNSQVAIDLVAQLENLLSASFPDRSEEVKARAHDLRSQLARHSSTITEQLESLGSRRFIALHDAYAGLAREFQLEQIGYLVDRHGNRAGARSLWQLSESLQAEPQACVFTQPQFSTEVLASLGYPGDWILAELDPQAGVAYAGGGSFSDYLAGIQLAMLDCLRQAHGR